MILASYTSIIYDVTKFGIYNIKNMIVGSDCDNGISIDVSFDGGASFLYNVSLDKKISVPISKGKIQFKIKFNDINITESYLIKTSGFFPDFEIGTVILFENNNTKKIYETNILENGKYSICIPKGIYKVYTKLPNNIILLDGMNPEAVIQPAKRLDKETIVESYIDKISWVKNAIYDVFDNDDKNLIGDASIDIDGDLSDRKTPRKCRWIVVGFE